MEFSVNVLLSTVWMIATFINVLLVPFPLSLLAVITAIFALSQAFTAGAVWVAERTGAENPQAEVAKLFATRSDT